MERSSSILSVPDIRIPDIQLGVPVKVNIENGVAAIALAWLNGVTAEEIKHGMATFAGPRRRFDFHLKEGKYRLDRRLCPSSAELQASILSVKELYAGRKVTGIFQPHLYTVRVILPLTLPPVFRFWMN